jgi:hypothetical protein
MSPYGVGLDSKNLTNSLLLGCKRLKKAQYGHWFHFSLEERIFWIAALRRSGGRSSTFSLWSNQVMAIKLSPLLSLAISFDENESDFYWSLYAILKLLHREKPL